MHHTNILRRVLRTIEVIPFTGELYRTLHAEALYGFSKPGLYKPRPLYSFGPSTSGARYTPKGGAASIYLAEDIETSTREALDIKAPKPLKPSQNFSALATYKVAVKLESILDLTQLRIRRQLGTNLNELAENWRPRLKGRKRKSPTQLIGALAATGGRIQGIRFRSTKKSGLCIVIFVDAIISPSFVEVKDPRGKLIERLPE